MNNGKICVSVCAETADEMIAKIKQAEQFADVIEVRFDCLEPREISDLRSQISNLRLNVPLLATFRSKEQGGQRAVTFDERREFWNSNQSEYWGGDFEIDVFGSSDGWRTRIISDHDFAGVPADLDAIYEKFAASVADIIKLAVTVKDIADCLPIWKLLERAQTERRHLIPIAMGDAGKWTRILGLAHGAFMTYASLESGNETAPGQVTAKDLVEVYRVKELDKDTQVFGVLGDPVTQSLSPYMHNPAFGDRGVNAVFISLLVKNIDEFIRRMVRPETREVELNFGGFSVTMPHKQAIIPHLDAIDPTAKAIGAVNTVKIIDGKLTGYNTDAHGFISPLKAKYGDVYGAKVAVIGAGGAARACVYALKQEGANVTVFARDAAKGTAFAGEFGVRFSEISNFRSEISDNDDQGPKTKDQRPKTILSDFDILVDTTPLGMKGPYENDSLFTADELTGLKFVYDLVTKTTDTPLIAEAKKAGVLSTGGLDMLIAQGCKQFEIWTGIEAPAELMRDSLVARMPKYSLMNVEALNCPNCGAGVESDRTQCQFCRCRLKTMACPACLGLMFEGSQFCGHCGSKAVETAITDESKLGSCPRCKIKLSLLEIGDTKLRECERCDGMWADVETFEHLCATGEERSAVLGFLGERNKTVELSSTISYVPCPDCKELMNRSNFAKASGVIIDICKRHGVWFDAGELPRIIEFIQKGGMDLARQREKMAIEAERDQLRDEQRKFGIQNRRFDMNLANQSDDELGIKGFLARLLD